MYKPGPKPYRMTPEQLSINAASAAFVAGSSYNMFDMMTVGLRTHWHNWIGLTPMEDAQLPEITSPTLDDLLS